MANIACIIGLHIFSALKNIRKYNKAKFSNFEEFRKISNIDYSKFEWRQPSEQITDEEFKKPFEAVENYLKTRLIDLFESGSANINK